MKKILLSLTALLFLSIGNSFAQQVPHYTQYMYNMNILNPAYAGSKGTDVISFGTLYRNQWAGADGAPKTLTANIHAAFNPNNGVGLSFINDNYTAIKQNVITADYSHTLHLGNANLAFGLKAGIHSYNVNNDVYVRDPNDPFFLNGEKGTRLNLGAGLFYYTDKYYLSVSVPNFVGGHGSQNRYNTLDKPNLFVAGGYVFDLSKDFKLKPHFLLFNVINQPIQTDINLNMLYLNTFELGISYRTNDAVSGMANVRLFKSLHVGMAYDVHISDISAYSPVSYEFFLNYDWSLNPKVMLSPRYF